MLNKRRDAKHLSCERKLCCLAWHSVTNTFTTTLHPHAHS